MFQEIISIIVNLAHLVCVARSGVPQLDTATAAEQAAATGEVVIDEEESTAAEEVADAVEENVKPSPESSAVEAGDDSIENT